MRVTDRKKELIITSGGKNIAPQHLEGKLKQIGAVSQAVGYETRSVLCAPIATGGRVRGALELLNREGGAFGASDVAVLSFLAHKAAELLARVD
mgnify:CR=1 FL=1